MRTEPARRPTRVAERVRDALRPVSPAARDALARRWAELPEHVRTPAQTLGRFGVECEGTHGVFPRCNFSCTPCYHSSDANRVRVDGPHTVTEVESQMAFFGARAPHAHAQLIGGEVTLLDPDDHAAALLAMRRHGREPMSFSHGDIDLDYLERLVTGPDGRRRLARLSFAVHIDSTMRGRRGQRRVERETDLTPERVRVAAMFARLREHGVRTFLAHNVTVTPENVDQIPDLLAGARRLGYGMFSFQPAAFVGDDRRWRSDYSLLDPDRVWARIEEGAGARLPYRVLQVGDLRCNRTAWGFYTGERWVSLLDEDDPRDLAARDALFTHLGGFHFSAPAPLVALRLGVVALSHPRLVGTALAWARRTVRRAGGWRRVLTERPRLTTFVMHRFMDAAQVAPAWALLEAGEVATDPEVREVQERLAACSYLMAHPEDGRTVPACVQHGVLDPRENLDLAQRLPLPRRRGAAAA